MKPGKHSPLKAADDPQASIRRPATGGSFVIEPGGKLRPAEERDRVKAAGAARRGNDEVKTDG